MRGNIATPQGPRTLNKILETAETSGHLALVNRRLKEIRELIFKHNFSNLTHVDLSRNRLSEFPPELLDWHCLKSLALSHNVLKNIPELISELMLLEVINFSHNQLTVLPKQICELGFLKILKLCGNRLISLPEEICQLKNCQELDVSVNELTSIPKEISQMTSLLYLNVRRNNIYTLPEEISQIQLMHLDASCNLIMTIPISFQGMTSLQTLLLDNNPLSSPRLAVLRKGRVHLFRELEIQAERAQIKKDVLDDPLMSPLKRSNSSIRSDFLKMKQHSMSLSETKPGADEERLEKAAELSRDRRKASVTSTTTTTNNIMTERKAPSPKKRELIAAPKRQMSSDNIPTRKPKTPPKTVIPKERKRSASSGNFERKSSTETLLIHQKLSNFPGYKPVLNEKNDTQTQNSSPSSEKSTENKQPSHTDRSALPNRPSSFNTKKGFMPTAIKPRSSLNRSRGSSFNTGNDKEGPFTMRRKTEKLYEELELMENLRQTIESRLKTHIGDEVSSSLSDGVILCHLVNHVRQRSIAMVHIPSPAVPKLSLAKRRRNIDSFLDACAKIGVPTMYICSAQDILLEKNFAKVATTVNELLKFSPKPTQSPKRQVETPTVRVTASVVSKQHSVV